MKVEIDKYSGFCSGVKQAIKKAEEILGNTSKLYCLGHIVHNKVEETRLENMGLKPIEFDNFSSLKNKTVLIRAHGEPPKTYNIAEKNNLNLINATCPVVLNLQKTIRRISEKHPDSTIIIYGKKGHAEVNGLVGQTKGKAIVISDLNEAKNLNLNNNIFMFAQTTANKDEYIDLIKHIEDISVKSNGNAGNIHSFDTICPSVKDRIPRLIEFVISYDVIIFVSDPESSNGKMLFDVCKKNNKNSHFITNIKEIKKSWFSKDISVGISGATSTPLWLMADVKAHIRKFFEK